MRKASRKMYVKLTDADRMILDSYCALSTCLGTCLGSAYEIAVHSFGEDDQFTLRIVNGSNTRNIDVMLPDMLFNGIEQLQSRHKRGEPVMTDTFGVRPDGRKCRFSFIGIIGTEGKLIGMLNISFWLDVPLSDVIRNFSFPSYLDAASLPLPISDSGRYNTALKQEIVRVRDAVMSDPEIPAKFKRKEIVHRLNDAGVFKVKNAIQICADTLDITIATIYMHIRNLESN